MRRLPRRWSQRWRRSMNEARAPTRRAAPPIGDMDRGGDLHGSSPGFEAEHVVSDSAAVGEESACCIGEYMSAYANSSVYRQELQDPVRSGVVAPLSLLPLSRHRI